VIQCLIPILDNWTQFANLFTGELRGDRGRMKVREFCKEKLKVSPGIKSNTNVLLHITS